MHSLFSHYYIGQITVINKKRL